MGSSPSMDFELCYPPMITPFWVIFIGFITSVIITNVTYSSGRGILSLFKAAICCRCCCKKKVNLQKTHNWSKYPRIIKLQSVHPFSVQKEATRIYGNYFLKHESDAGSDTDPVAYYRSESRTSFNAKHYTLRFLQERHLQGWILQVDDEKDFKYEMVAGSDSMTYGTGLDAPLLISESKQAEPISAVHTDDALALIGKKRQKYTVYPQTRKELGTEFWDQNISSTNVLNRETNRQRAENMYFTDPDIIRQSEFVLLQHWIEVRGFEVYKHNVWNDEVVLDINGKYQLVKVQDSTSDSSIDPSVVFSFQHESNEKLSMVIDVRDLTSAYRKKKFRKSEISGKISHANLKTLAQFGQISQTEVSTAQYVYDQGVDVILKIESVSCLSYGVSKMIELVLFALVIYQLVYDVMCLVEFGQRKDSTFWITYQCYAFIISNSANMKQVWVFVICYIFSGNSFEFRRYSWIGYILFAVMAFYGGLWMLSVSCTHWFPFLFAYLWIVMCFICFFRGIIPCMLKFDPNEGFGTLLVGCVWILCFYFVSFLWPVAAMSKLYAGKGYMWCFYSVYTDRPTVDYVFHYVSAFQSLSHFVTHLFVWIV